MKPKNSNNIECFNRYKIISDKLDSIEIPERLWGFVSSMENRVFDLIDIIEHFKCDMAQAKRVLNFLVSKQLCSSEKASKISYQDWKADNFKSLHDTEITVESDPPQAEADILVTKHTKDIHLEIG